MRIFVGYDPREEVAFNVLCHSIWSRASVPVSITPLRLDHLPTDRRGSTDFSFSRFLVPWLCDFEGHALFLDCDMLCLGDVAELREFEGPQVSVCKVEYHPKSTVKFLGEKQTDYPMKCWSAVMLFNNRLCRRLTPGYVNRASGLNLHQFTWADEIGELPLSWQTFAPEAGDLLHYTEGGPWFEDYRDCPLADLWHDEYRDMLCL